MRCVDDDDATRWCFDLFEGSNEVLPGKVAGWISGAGTRVNGLLVEDEPETKRQSGDTSGGSG